MARDLNVAEQQVRQTLALLQELVATAALQLRQEVRVALFLLVYDRRTGSLDVDDEYPDADRASAMQRRFELEREHRLDPNIEVVLLEARSREVLEQTHARYFRTVRELIARA